MCCKTGESKMSNRQLKNVRFFVLIGLVFIALVTLHLTAKEKKSDEIQTVKTPVKIDKFYQRDSLRAFYTAPPVIPHAVGNLMKSDECMHCHKEFRDLGDRKSIKTPHAEFSNCMQCHVNSDTSNVKDYEPVKSSFKGLVEPKKGIKAHEFAPPMMPHRLFLRENCISCHNPEHPNQELRSPHIDRSNCLQCHAPLKENEF